jgi:hypothetical protein
MAGRAFITSLAVFLITVALVLVLLRRVPPVD